MNQREIFVEESFSILDPKKGLFSDSEGMIKKKKKAVGNDHKNDNP